RALLAAALLLHILPFAVRPALIGGDEPHYALMAHSIATDFDLALDDDYDAVEEGSPAAGRKRSGEALDRHLRDANGRRVFSHPIGLPLLAAPIVAIQQAIAPGSAPDIPLVLLTLAVTFAALVSAAKLLWGVTGSIRGTSLLLFATYFASPMWFYSRTFFTEPYIWAWSVLAITSMARRKFGLATLFLALALAMKETALLIVLPLTIAGGLLFGVRALLVLAAGPAVFAALFALKNLLTVDNAFPTFQPYQWGDLFRGAVQLSISSDRGLLWFAPLLALSVVGWFLRDKLTPRVVVWTSAAIFASWFLVAAGWVDPAGGSSYGPRLLVPALPALLIPLYRLGAHYGGRGGGIVFAVFALTGFVVNWCAALDPFTAFWGSSALELVQKNVLAAGAGAILGIAILSTLARMHSPSSLV
ncbi:MAG: hypothetical protein LC732_10875, partial [Acidobacteria bacterium]|nr:hypothetical protein [Acidobacteriota bacterium]